MFSGFGHPAFWGFVLMFIGLRLSILIVVCRALRAAVDEGDESQAPGADFPHEAKCLRRILLWYLFPFLVGLSMLLLPRGPSSEPSPVVPAMAVIIASVLAVALGIRAAFQLKRDAELSE